MPCAQLDQFTPYSVIRPLSHPFSQSSAITSIRRDERILPDISTFYSVFLEHGRVAVRGQLIQVGMLNRGEQARC